MDPLIAALSVVYPTKIPPDAVNKITVFGVERRPRGSVCLGTAYRMRCHMFCLVLEGFGSDVESRAALLEQFRWFVVSMVGQTTVSTNIEKT